ncbi:hypothetical protein Tco_0523086 [Tanacetum coccineum]
MHLVYLKHLKESVETLCEIVEEAKVDRPFDSSLASACHYTKHSQELLEYVVGTCPKALNTRDNKLASTSLPNKKQVTFEEQCAMSKSNTHKPVEQLNCQKTNVHVPPSTGVNSCTDASRSQPRSNTKKKRILPAKSVNMKKVEEHPRIIKSSLKTTNCVNYSINTKHTVINLNSHSVCQTCNKCLISTNHDMCVVSYLHSLNASPFVKNVVHKVNQVWKPKQVKQVWKPTCNILTIVGYQWMPTERTFTLGEQCPLTRLTKPNKVSVIAYANPREPNHNCSKHMTGDRSGLKNFMNKFIETVRFGNDHFGAIMGYGDYVIGESVISGDNADLFQGLSFYGESCFGALCDPTNRSAKILESSQQTVMLNIRWLTEQIAHVQLSTGPAPTFLMPGQKSSGLVLNPVPAAPYVPPTNKDLEVLFQPMFDEYLEPPRVERPVSPTPAVQVKVNSTGTPSSTTIDQDAPSPSYSPSSSALQSPSLHQGVAVESPLMKDNPFAHIDNDHFINVFALEPRSEASSFGDLSSTESLYASQTLHHLKK